MVTRFAYADPPYPGMCSSYDHDHRDGCWDEPETHAALIERLGAFDGWGLSTHEPGLRVVVPMLPEGTRICPWVKPWVNMRPGARIQYGWEPVIVKAVRKPSRSVHDWVSCNPTRLRGFFWLGETKTEGRARNAKLELVP